MNAPHPRLLETLVVCGQPVTHWVAAAVGGHFDHAGSFAIGLERRGELQAGVIYENWNRASVMCHIRIDGRLTRDYLHKIFEYPFVKLEVCKIIAPVASHNMKCRGLVENMGFREEGRLQDCHPEGDMLLYTLRRDQCRFLPAGGL